MRQSSFLAFGDRCEMARCKQLTTSQHFPYGEVASSHLPSNLAANAVRYHTCLRGLQTAANAPNSAGQMLKKLKVLNLMATRGNDSNTLLAVHGICARIKCPAILTITGCILFIMLSTLRSTRVFSIFQRFRDQPIPLANNSSNHIGCAGDIRR